MTKHISTPYFNFVLFTNLGLWSMPQCLILDTLDGWSMVLVIKPASGAATCFYGAVCNLIWPPVGRRWFHFVFGVWRTFGYSKIFACCGVEHARTRELSLSFPMTQCLIFDTLDGWSMVFLSRLPVGTPTCFYGASEWSTHAPENWVKQSDFLVEFILAIIHHHCASFGHFWQRVWSYQIIALWQSFNGRWNIYISLIIFNFVSHFICVQIFQIDLST